MRIGDIVRNRESGIYGTVEYSSFGYSIHSWVKYEGQFGLSKTLGAPASELLEYWEVVELPEGYEVADYGGLRKVD
jgi:hypothetical protein